jgi:hypothetical protein
MVAAENPVMVLERRVRFIIVYAVANVSARDTSERSVTSRAASLRICRANGRIAHSETGPKWVLGEISPVMSGFITLVEKG